MWACTLRIMYLISGPSCATCLEHCFWLSTLSPFNYMSAKISVIPIGVMKIFELSFFSQESFNRAKKTNQARRPHKRPKD